MKMSLFERGHKKWKLWPDDSVLLVCFYLCHTNLLVHITKYLLKGSLGTLYTYVYVSLGLLFINKHGAVLSMKG